MGKKDKLPKEIIVFHNPEKVHNESWNQQKIKNPANLPSPYQALLLGVMNSGKSNVVRNLLIQQKPPFRRILLWINEGSKEYDDLIDEGAEVYYQMPTLEEIIGEDDDEKKVLIIDDINLKSHNPTLFTTLLRNYSSHHNMSVIVTIHDLKNIPPENRRLFNFLCIFRALDMISVSQLAQKVGLPSKDFKFLMCKSGLIKTRFDFLTIDNTNDTPYPLRLNIFQPIEIVETDDKNKEFILFKNYKEYLDFKGINEN